LATGFATSSGGAIAIHRGNIDAFAPQSEESFWAITRGDFPSPYLPEARLVQIPERPDFLAAGDVIGQNGPGLVAAARGGRKLYVAARGASGQMTLLQTVDVPGAITGLDVQQLWRGAKYTQVVLGAQDASGYKLLVYNGAHEGLSAVAAYRMNGPATRFA